MSLRDSLALGSQLGKNNIGSASRGEPWDAKVKELQKKGVSPEEAAQIRQLRQEKGNVMGLLGNKTFRFGGGGGGGGVAGGVGNYINSMTGGNSPQEQYAKLAAFIRMQSQSPSGGGPTEAAAREEQDQLAYQMQQQNQPNGFMGMGRGPSIKPTARGHSDAGRGGSIGGDSSGGLGAQMQMRMQYGQQQQDPYAELRKLMMQRAKEYLSIQKPYLYSTLDKQR